MARKLAKNTLDRLHRALLQERDRLVQVKGELEADIEKARMAESSAERSPDPSSGEGGSMAYEYIKELSIERNTSDLLHQVERALARIEKKTYGTCETCGKDIPVARLQALPHATQCVECATRS